MDLFQIIFKHGWVLFIAVTFINAYTLKYHSKKHISKNPELAIGYKKLFKGSLIYLNIPWLIMGFGMLSGMTNNIFEFMTPRTLNPIVLIFNVTLISLYLLCLWWIFIKDGAKFLKKHPGLIKISSLNGSKEISVNKIKFIIGLMIFGGIIALIFMWTNYFNLPLNNLKQLPR